MAIIGSNPMPSKVIKKKNYLQVKVFFNYQNILDQKEAQTFERKRSQKK
jgi:hypothetical protein